MELRNKIKISLFVGDVQNSWENTKDKDRFFTIQRFNYNLLKNRYDSGTPCEITERTVMEFELKSPRINQLQELYGKMREKETSFFSFLFNPRFGENNELVEYDGAMIVEGCLCLMCENYVSHESKVDERVTMLASLMLYSVTYTGGANNASQVSLRLI
ncbi:hypothetical protein [Parabacteroides sp.]